MKVRHTFLVSGDAAHRFLHQEITLLPGSLTELYQTEDYKWYLRKVCGVEQISGELAIQILGASKIKKKACVY
ncbi:hypothetical protein OCK74_14490 [Chitinophagaceae bacterium LB-8]|jgi:hypothetical protein|uniref:Uncharacterized protein n=1 Tax=Paraflavisolibacter caeni TaxID=2982496 RepID=A0A9X3BHX1_9BACT|nr:hypothetical protein [Paraflavisolibacter caeni]MCU7550327.1 hypothetical protein [Paraflavisolibacter caeni]